MSYESHGYRRAPEPEEPGLSPVAAWMVEHPDALQEMYLSATELTYDLQDPEGHHMREQRNLPPNPAASVLLFLNNFIVHLTFGPDNVYRMEQFTVEDLPPSRADRVRFLEGLMMLPCSRPAVRYMRRMLDQVEAPTVETMAGTVDWNAILLEKANTLGQMWDVLGEGTEPEF